MTDQSGASVSEAVVDLLGALSYAQLSGFEALAADAQMTPHLRAKMAFARMGVEMFHRCEQVGVRLGELGMSQEQAMTPFVAAVDAFHERSKPRRPARGSGSQAPPRSTSAHSRRSRRSAPGTSARTRTKRSPTRRDPRAAGT